MDLKLPPNQELERLIRLAAASRSCLTSEVIALRQRLDFPTRIRGSLKSHPTAWLFGSLASGFAGSLMFRRKSAAPETKPRGSVVTLLGLALTAARPFAKVWLADQVKSYLIGRPGTVPANPPRSQSKSVHPI